ncbi:MAG: methyltransferase domain-containing protein [Candidatus Melainabacteria bacterium]|nr:methyltransferase domain-containing protein [Candidatus Melainabacteria bacterium]
MTSQSKETPASTGIFGKLERELILISLLSLFCELMIIRWLATEMRIFAYFKNLPLMAAFLGLGLGFVWTNRNKDYMKLSAYVFLYLCGLLICALGLHLTFLTFVDPFKFMLFGVGAAGVQGATPGNPIFTTLLSLVVMLGAFTLGVLTFVGYGQRIGQLFELMSPLKAYSLNVFGALAGTILFSALCWFNCSPGIWMAVVGVGLFIWKKRLIHVLIIVLALVYTFALAPFMAKSFYGPDYVETIWSPYYRIDLVKDRVQNSDPKANQYCGYAIYVNYDNFQQIVDCTPETLAKFPEHIQKQMRFAFERPFKFPTKTPEDVLILGTGNGSDVAAALRCGATHVDAIEIDPGIIQLGKKRHPEQPYASDKVTLRNMDARTFLKTTDKKYDVILFAYVDSHAAFSSLSSLRMDNYLFTQESLNDAARHLKKDGIIVIGFLSFADWLYDRHSKALGNATKMEPLGFCINNERVDVGYLVSGPGAAGRKGSLNTEMPERAVNMNSPTPVSTDDWPFLFLPKREVPAVYMLPIFSVLLLGFGLVAREFKQGINQAMNWQMFLTGMGFMLLEVRAMSVLSLLYGSTWLVNCTVISGVMIVILIANYFVAKFKLNNLFAVGACVVLALLGTTFTEVSSLTQLGEIPAQIAGTMIFLLPMVFASVMFAILFKETKSASTSLAFNIVGGLVGVCVEYLSMLIGLRALGAVAILIYAGVLLLEKMKKSKAPLDGESPSDNLQTGNA